MKSLIIPFLLATTTANATIYYNDDGSPDYIQINNHMAQYMQDLEIAQQAYSDILKALSDIVLQYHIAVEPPEWIEFNGNRFYYSQLNQPTGTK